jgi:hypothetical protein
MDRLSTLTTAQYQELETRELMRVLTAWLEKAIMWLATKARPNLSQRP